MGNLILLSGGLTPEFFVQGAGTRTLHKLPLPKAVGVVKISDHEICTDDGYCGNLNSAGYWNKVIKDLSSSYGVTFSGKGWKQKDRLNALTAVVVVAQAVSKHSDVSSADTFRAVFGELTFSASQGDGNKWACERSANPSGVSCETGKSSLDPRLMAHELAHVFNAMYVNGGHTNSPYTSLGGSTISYTEGDEEIWVTGLQYDPVEGVKKWSRGYLGYRTANGYYDDPMVYHGPVDWPNDPNTNSTGEEFADMFMNWAFNSFDSSKAGAARYNWMNGEISRVLDVMIP